eukprot:3094436-Rhodomonas_salina.3
MLLGPDAHVTRAGGICRVPVDSDPARRGRSGRRRVEGRGVGHAGNADHAHQCAQEQQVLGTRVSLGLLELVLSVLALLRSSSAPPTPALSLSAPDVVTCAAQQSRAAGNAEREPRALQRRLRDVTHSPRHEPHPRQRDRETGRQGDRETGRVKVCEMSPIAPDMSHTSAVNTWDPPQATHHEPSQYSGQVEWFFLLFSAAFSVISFFLSPPRNPPLSPLLTWGAGSRFVKPLDMDVGRQED